MVKAKLYVSCYVMQGFHTSKLLLLYSVFGCTYPAEANFSMLNQDELMMGHITID